MQTTQSAWVVQIYQRWIWHSGRLKTATNHPMSLMVWPIHTSLFSRTVSPALPRFQGSYSPHTSPKWNQNRQILKNTQEQFVCIIVYFIGIHYLLSTVACALLVVYTHCACLKNVVKSHTRLQSSIALLMLLFCYVYRIMSYSWQNIPQLHN